ncbi:MAG: hypothetical protein V4654_02305 [Bdellovibrionota bacterium]
MKKFMLAIFCLKALSCELSDLTDKKTEDENDKIVYVGNFSVDNLETLSLRTMIPERIYDLNIASQSLTISNAECRKELTLSTEEIAIILNDLKAVHICELETRASTCNEIYFVTTILTSYVTNAIDPDHLTLDLPRQCLIQRGVCSHSDIGKAVGAFERHKKRFTCLNEATPPYLNEATLR